MSTGTPPASDGDITEHRRHERAIAKSLREAGLLSRCDKGRNTAKVSVLGARRSVYVFRMADILDLDPATASPVGYDLSDVPF